MHLIIPLLTVAALFLLALTLDGKLPQAPLVQLANFSVKGAPATNGILYGCLFWVVLLLC